MISIIIPTYNSQNTIVRCINSILKINSRINYEIILVDDGSNDNTPNINNKYSTIFSNIYSINESNKGVSQARNNGIYYSHGQWICFVDSDDFIDADKFVKIIKLYINKENNLDLVITNLNLDGKNIGMTNGQYVLSNVRSFLKRNYPLYGNEIIHVACNKIYRSSIIKTNNLRFPKGIEIGEDLIFFLRYLMYIRHLVVQTRFSYYHYYMHTYSATNSFEHHALKSRMMIINDVKKVYYTYNLSFNALLSLRVKAVYSVLLNSLYKSNNRINYLRIMKKSIVSLRLSKKLKYSKNIKDDILIFAFRQPSISALLSFLYVINIIRRIIFKIKF